MICAGLMSVVIFMYLFTSDILPHCLLLSLVFFLLFYIVFVIVVAAVLILLFLFYSDIYSLPFYDWRERVSETTVIDTWQKRCIAWSYR